MFGAAVTMAAVAWWVVRHRGRRRRERAFLWQQFCAEWKQAAGCLRLTFGRGERPGLVKLSGSVDGFDVLVETKIDRSVTRPLVELTRFQVLVPGLRIQRLEAEHKRARGEGGERVEIGDPAFDRAVFVSGDVRWVRALMSVATREAIAEEVKRFDLVIEGSVMSAFVAGHLDDSGALITRIDTMIRLAKRLTLAPSSLPDRLLTSAKNERIPRARQSAFRLLFTHYASHPAVADTLESLARDRDPFVRLLAAQAMGEAGLLKVQMLAGDTEVPLELRQIAYCHLAQWGSRDPRLMLFVAQALAEESAPIAGALARFVAHSKLRFFAPQIAKRLERAVEPTLILSCLLALSRVGSSAHERAITGLLAHPDLEIKLAAVKAIAHVGTLASIEALRPLANGLLIDSNLKEQARRAIDAVRARAPNGEAGCLSLAEGSAQSGALSLGAERGALGLTDEGSSPP